MTNFGDLKINAFAVTNQIILRNTLDGSTVGGLVLLTYTTLQTVVHNHEANNLETRRTNSVPIRISYYKDFLYVKQQTEIRY
jgi:hypothetical protein